MKIALTFNLSERDRLAIANRFGETEPVPYTIAKRFLDGVIDSELESLSFILQEKEEREEGIHA